MFTCPLLPDRFGLEYLLEIVCAQTRAPISCIFPRQFNTATCTYEVSISTSGNEAKTRPDTRRFAKLKPYVCHVVRLP
jgi:hypothetical protein